MTTKTLSDVFKKPVWTHFFKKVDIWLALLEGYRNYQLSLRIVAGKSDTDHTDTLKELPQSSCCYSYAGCT